VIYITHGIGLAWVEFSAGRKEGHGLTTTPWILGLYFLPDNKGRGRRGIMERIAIKILLQSETAART
jgi:hypothetical protein